MGVGFTPLHLFVTCAEDIFFNYRETRGDAFVLRDLLDTSMLSLHHLLPAGFEKPEFRIAFAIPASLRVTKQTLKRGQIDACSKTNHTIS